MTFKRIGLFLCLATAAMLSPLFAQRNVSGVWRLRVQRPDGTTQDRFLKLTQSENSVAGTIVTNYRPAPIRTGSFENGKLHLEVSPRGRMTITYDGSLAADRLNLKITTNRPSSSRPTEVLEATGERSTEEASLPPKPLPVPALHDVPDNGLVRTPPMGWNSWNHFAGRVSDATVRAAADAIVASGMKAAGYEYVNIDDTWEGTRDANGNIQSNRKFPDMKALAAYVHSKGLKIGLYSSPGPLTCAGYEGSFGHEEQDAKTYADWGFDYLKYDWCSAGAI
jgi:alpha-galactosidase